jgi:hypothetical protein
LAGTAIVKKVLKGIGYTIVVVPILLLAECMYRETAQQRGLQALCATATSGKEIKPLLIEAAKTDFEVRTGGAISEDEHDWFDREYLRYRERLKTAEIDANDYTVVFAKPGIGYYACIIIHRDTVVTDAWFEDNSG